MRTPHCQTRQSWHCDWQWTFSEFSGSRPLVPLQPRDIVPFQNCVAQQLPPKKVLSPHSGQEPTFPLPLPATEEERDCIPTNYIAMAAPKPSDPCGNWVLCSQWSLGLDPASALKGLGANEVLGSTGQIRIVCLYLPTRVGLCSRGRGGRRREWIQGLPQISQHTPNSGPTLPLVVINSLFDSCEGTRSVTRYFCPQLLPYCLG